MPYCQLVCPFDQVRDLLDLHNVTGIDSDDDEKTRLLFLSSMERHFNDGEIVLAPALRARWKLKLVSAISLYEQNIRDSLDGAAIKSLETPVSIGIAVDFYITFWLSQTPSVIFEARTLAMAMQLIGVAAAPLLHRLTRIVLTLPVGSCTPERSFSAMKRVITPLRATMTIRRFNNIAKTHFSPLVEVDTTAVLTEMYQVDSDPDPVKQRRRPRLQQPTATVASAGEGSLSSSAIPSLPEQKQDDLDEGSSEDEVDGKLLPAENPALAADYAFDTGSSFSPFDLLDDVNSPRFYVDRIIGKKQRGRWPVFLVKWQGYDESESTWEPLSNLDSVGAREEIRKYEASIGEQPSPEE